VLLAPPGEYASFRFKSTAAGAGAVAAMAAATLGDGCRRRDATASVASSRHGLWRTKVCRYSWHSAGSLHWPFPMLKYKLFFK